MEVEYIYPTRSSRLRVLGGVLLPAAVVAGGYVLAQAYTDYVAPLEVCDQVPWARLALLLLGLVVLVPTWVYGRMAWGVYAHRQFPPPGAAVFFKTKVHRGLYAAVQGISAFAICAILAGVLGYIATSEMTQVIFGQSCSG